MGEIMKYGESAFDIIYLIFGIVCGCIILAKSKNRTAKLMGLAAIVLGYGDAFISSPECSTTSWTPISLLRLE